MVTPNFICGAECGLAVVGTAGPAGTTRHWSTVGGTVSVVTSGPSPMRSTRCFRFNPTATTAALTHTFASAIGSPATFVARFYIYFATLPNAVIPLLFENGSINAGGAWFNNADNKIYAGRSGPNLGASGVSVTTGQWYCVDVKAVRNTTYTVDVSVDGVACGQVSLGGQSAGTIAAFVAGNTGSNFTADFYIDDIETSGTAGDFPLSGGTVVGLYPNADGTHNFNANNDFLRNGSTNFNTGSTDGYTLLQNPLTTTVGNFISAANEATSEYVRFVFPDLPSEANAVHGVNVVSTHHSATTTGNAQDLLIIDGSASSGTTIVTEIAALGSWSTNVFGTGADMSETSIIIASKIAATGASTGAWTVANVNDLDAIFGATDVTPDDHLDGVCLEVAITTNATADAVVVTPTATIPAASASGTSGDATASAVVVAATATASAPTGSTVNTVAANTRTATVSAAGGGVAHAVAVAVARAKSAIAFPAQTTAGGSSTAAASVSFSHVLGSGPNRVVVVAIMAEIASTTLFADVTGVTYNGVAMTKADDASITGEAQSLNGELWYMLEASLPAAGTYTVAVTCDQSAQEIVAVAAYVVEVTQASPEVTNRTSTLVDQTAPSVSVTTLSPNAWAVDVAALSNVTSAPNEYFVPTDFAPQTLRAVREEPAGGSGGAVGLSTKLVTTPGATTMTWRYGVPPNGAVFGGVSRWAAAVAVWPPADGVPLVTGTGDAVANAQTVVATATIPAATGSTANTVAAVAAIATTNALTGSTSNVAPVVPLTVTVNALTGSTANTVAVDVVTVTTPNASATTSNPDATANALAVAASITTNAATGSTANTVAVTTAIANRPTITQVQKKQAANVTGLSITATFDSTPAAGNLLISAIGTGFINGLTITPPSGWTVIAAENTHNTGGGPRWMSLAYKIAGASEPTAVTWNVSSSINLDAIAFEYSGLASVLSIDKTVTAFDSAMANALALGPTGSTVQASELAMVAVVIANGRNSEAFTGGFTRESVSGSRSLVGSQVLAATGTVSTTASWGGATSESAGAIGTLRAAIPGELIGSTTDPAPVDVVTVTTPAARGSTANAVAVVVATATSPNASATSTADATANAVTVAAVAVVGAVTGSTANPAPVVVGLTTAGAATGSTSNTVTSVVATATTPAASATGGALGSAITVTGVVTMGGASATGTALVTAPFVAATTTTSAATGSTANTVAVAAANATMPAASATGTAIVTAPVVVVTVTAAQASAIGSGASTGDAVTVIVTATVPNATGTGDASSSAIPVAATTNVAVLTGGSANPAPVVTATTAPATVLGSTANTVATVLSVVTTSQASATGGALAAALAVTAVALATASTATGGASALATTAPVTALTPAVGGGVAQEVAGVSVSASAPQAAATGGASGDALAVVAQAAVALALAGGGGLAGAVVASAITGTAIGHLGKLFVPGGIGTGVGRGPGLGHGVGRTGPGVGVGARNGTGVAVGSTPG